MPVTPYIPPRLLGGAHAQTILASFLVGGAPSWRRARWETPDDDFLDVEIVEPAVAGAPVVALMHGLGGSTQSGYMRAQTLELAERGAGVVAVNSRGSSGVPNRQPRLYHAGETDDLAFVILTMAARWPGRPLAMIGFSLGGSRLLNFVARRPEARMLTRAVAVSAPLDLSECVDVLDHARPPLYTRYLLRGLKRILALRPDLAGAIDYDRARRAPTVRDFDDAVIAPLHGFASGADYYARCSAGPALDAIEGPTLLVRAEDDPFLARSDLRFIEGGNGRGLQVERTAAGGHVGFLGPWLRPWVQRRAASFVTTAS